MIESKSISFFSKKFIDIEIVIKKPIEHKKSFPSKATFKQGIYAKMGLRYLYWASILGREDLVFSLIQFNFSPFLVSYKGRNAVHAAAFHAHLHLLKLFFESDLSKRFLNRFGSIEKVVNLMTEQRPETALHIAIQRVK
jgi:anoctamin-10